MSANLTPAYPSGPVPAGNGALAPFGAAPAALARPADAAAEPSANAQIGRIAAALNRYKWLIGALTAAGTIAGVVASRYTVPTYGVVSTIFLTAPQSANAAAQAGGGPIRQEQTFDAQGWMDLLHSYAITDAVVMQLGLYVEPKKAADTTAFRGFQINPRGFRPGQYTFALANGRWTLKDNVGAVNEQGVIGDSVGRNAGFLWVPSKAELGRDREIGFTVRTPREASINLQARTRIGLNQGSNVIFMASSGTAQQKPSDALNAWSDQFIKVATQLKTERVAQFSTILATQREEARNRLIAAQRNYEQFRVGAIALPSEAATVSVGPSGQAAVQNDAVMDQYWKNKFALAGLTREREQLERVAAGLGKGGTVPVTELLANQVVANDIVALPLRTSLQEILTRQQELRVLGQSETEIGPRYKVRADQLATLQNVTVPAQVKTLIGQLKEREATLGKVVGQSTQELEKIPVRTAQQEALRREYDGAKATFEDLDTRFRNSDLAQRSMTPDVRVLDRAVMPLDPVGNTAPKLISYGLAGGLGLGLALAFLLDRLDRRFRYPSQATHELGLQILGVVPEINQTRRQAPEKVAQIVESFRSIRMNVRYAVAPNPKVALTVTSPGPNDGKSLVASNLALAFAEGGWRTVLVDGDLRRGQLNTTFDLPSGPGLVEYLDGTSLLAEVIQATHHDNLAMVATGQRHRRGPELLATPRMAQLVAALQQEFDAVIVDSPPLGAGTDAYALGTATTHMALVLRRAATDLRMAKAKLEVLDTLPVQVIGVVLNEVESGAGMYQYFSYDPDYVLVDEQDEVPQLAAGAGAER